MNVPSLAYIWRLRYTTSGHSTKIPMAFPSYLPAALLSVHQPPLTPVISRRFKKRGKGWPTAFCRALFNPAGDPRSLSTLPPLLSPRTLSCALLFLSFTAFCAALHCVFFYEVMRSRWTRETWFPANRRALVVRDLIFRLIYAKYRFTLNRLVRLNIRSALYRKYFYDSSLFLSLFLSLPLLIYLFCSSYMHRAKY